MGQEFLGTPRGLGGSWGLPTATGEGFLGVPRESSVVVSDVAQSSDLVAVGGPAQKSDLVVIIGWAFGSDHCD